MSLEDLLKRVESCSGTDRALDAAILLAFTPGAVLKHGGEVYWTPEADERAVDGFETPEYTSSLDAALALVEEKLPGEYWQVFSDFGGGCHRAKIKICYGPQIAEHLSDCRSSAPLAVIEALLRALISQKEGVE